MAFKHKKSIEEILAMKFGEYAKFLKKEIKRAAKFGELDAVVCSQHTFADNKESALVLLGVYTGELAQFFKKNKAEQGFAKGKCFFEQTNEGTTMHIALNTGKGKPDKVKKGGKKLWAKLGINSKFYKGELPNLDSELDKVNVGEKEIEENVDVANDSQKIEWILKQYRKAKKALHQQVVPLIINPKTVDSDYTNQHFLIAKKALIEVSSFLDKIEEVEDEEKEKYQESLARIKKDAVQIKRIVAKIKTALMATNSVDVELNNQLNDVEQDAAVQTSLKDLDKEFERLDILKEQALKAIKLLKTKQPK
jgi:hypothetical protein